MLWSDKPEYSRAVAQLGLPCHAAALPDESARRRAARACHRSPRLANRLPWRQQSLPSHGDSETSAPEPQHVGSTGVN